MLGSARCADRTPQCGVPTRRAWSIHPSFFRNFTSLLAALVLKYSAARANLFHCHEQGRFRLRN